MKYTLIVTTYPQAMADLGDRMADLTRGFFDYNRALEAAGAYVAGEPLDAPDLAVTVRKRGDEVVETDGPFVETKEMIGGFYLVECKDRAEAVAWARKIPVVTLGVGSVEVRPCCVIPES